MNVISGKIVQKESGVGIPNLLVAIYDVDPGTRPEEFLNARSGPHTIGATALAVSPVPEGLGDRLGCIWTNEKGLFQIEFESEEFRIRNADERRPDLLLLVLTPEEPGKNLQDQILYASTVRQNAGKTEQYIFQFTSEQLEKAGIVPPTLPSIEHEQPKRIVERLSKAHLRLETIDQGVRQMNKRRADQTRRVATDFRTEFKPVLRKYLSTVSGSLLNSASFVTSGDSVFQKNIALIQQGIRETVNSDLPQVRAPITGLVVLTEEQEQVLRAQLPQNRTISEEALQEILGKTTSPKISTLIRTDPLARFCRDKTAEEIHCSAVLSGEAEDHHPTPIPPGVDEDIPGTGVETMTEQDIPKHVARIMTTQTSPEERVISGLEPRADRLKVEESVQSLSFPPSPADTPSFHNFHNLQIAFEHVWQEALDEGVLDLAEDAYQDIVELGGVPNGSDLSAINPIRALLDEGRLVLTSQREVRDHRGQTIVRDHRTGVTVRDHRGEVIVRDHRGEGRPYNPKGYNPSIIHVPPHPAERLPEVLSELEQRLKENYTFTTFAANSKERSINFGIMVTYCQEWDPRAYQAGKLVKTITLAPKETQKYTKKTVIHRKRSEKEVEKHVSSRRSEVSQTSRSEQEIIRRANTKTNFSLTSEDSIKLPAVDGASPGSTRTTSFQREASKASEDIKKGMLENTFKASQEINDEHLVELNFEESQDFETTESGEITNPNDEIAVTFLFYDLKRSYKLKQYIHQVSPVILVAQEMPKPHEIDEAWLIAHDWILKRVLLDDSFVPALDYVSQNIVGEQAALDEMRKNIAQQRQVVEELKGQLGVVRERMVSYRNLMERSLLHKAVEGSGRGGGLLSSIPVVGDVADAVVDTIEGVAKEVGDFLFPAENTGQSRQDALKEALQRTADEERDVLFRLEREVTALNAFTEAYSKDLSEYLNHRTLVARLRTHIKQNILHYMQAIWSHEPPDQRFFRLHQVQVPVLEATQRNITFSDLEPVSSHLANLPHFKLGLHGKPAVKAFRCGTNTKVDPNLKFTSLAQVANIDEFIGFKGNCMIFRLKESNALTDYMMKPYLIEGLDELMDPDSLGNWNLEDFAKYVCCLKEQLSETQFDQIKVELKEQYELLIQNPRRNSETITVPTNSLFIEALPARHSLIEEFKARHRAVDVKKVQAEVRQVELDNIRRAARILAKENEDPDIEKKIVVEGNTNGIHIPIGDN